MSKAFLIAFIAAAVVIVALIWTGFSKTDANHLAPTGSIGKVRTIQASDNLTLMVIDFKVKNDSDQDMVVRSLEAGFDSVGGATAGSMVAAGDAARAFKAYPLLGEQFNPVLKERDSIPAHQTLDRMVAVRFDVPFDKVEARRTVTLKLEDITGPVLELMK